MKRLVLLLGLALLAVGVWMMVPRAGDAPVPVGGLPGTEAAGPESGPTLRGDAGGEAGGEDEVEVADAGFERSEVEEVEATSPGSRFFHVLVTNKVTGEPVPGATVSWYENFATSTLDPLELEEYRSISSDREKLTSRYGRDLVADGEGRVVLPVQEYVRTTGRHGDLYGELNIRPDPEADADQEFVLELERDLTLRMRVVDSLGEPAAGVAIGLLPVWEDGSRDERPYGVGASEKPRGMLTVPHLQIRLARWKRQEPYPVSHLLRPNIPGLTEGGVDVDVEDLPSDPIVVRLPPTGRVVVEATDVRGTPLPGQVVRTAYLGLDSEDNTSEDFLFSLPSGQRWTGQAAEDGTTTFERVVADRDYVAAAVLGHEMTQTRFDGPLVEGQEVRVALSPTGEMVLVTGRALDEQGGPLRGQRLRVMYAVAGGGSGSTTVQADARGEFAIHVSTGPSTEGLMLTELSLEDRPTGAAANEPALMYTMVGERALVPGKNEVGDLVLSQGPLVASGRVLVNGEVPERRVSVRVERLEILPSRNTTREYWGSARLSIRYPENGRFEIRGVPQPGGYRVNVSSSSYLPLEPVPFAPGADDILLELDTGGTLEAVVLVDEEVPMGKLMLRLVPLDGPVVQDATSASRITMLGPSGILFRGGRFDGRPGPVTDGKQRFSWVALPPDSYRLEVLPRGARRPLVEVDQVQVAGGENEDPRLEAIDLRGRMRTIHVEVVGSDGLPITDRQARPLVFLNDPAPDAELQGFAVTDGKAAIVTSEPFVDLLVVARGYRPRELSGIGADTQVRLERFPEIRLRIAGGLPELPEGHSLQASIVERDRQRDPRRMAYENGGGSIDGSLRPVTTAQNFGGSAEVALQVGDDGIYTVRIRLRSESTRRSRYIEGIEPAEIDVRASLGQQVFQVRIPEESLKQTIEALAGR